MPFVECGRSYGAPAHFSPSFYNVSALQSRADALSACLISQSHETSQRAVYIDLFFQILFVIGLFITNQALYSIRTRRAKTRDLHRVANYDIERQTRRPYFQTEEQIKKQELIAKAISERHAHLPSASYTLSELEVRELHALKSSGKTSRHCFSFQLAHIRLATETTSLLPLTNTNIQKKGLSFTRAWNRITFKAALYTRWSARLLLKKIKFAGRMVHAWTMRQPKKVSITGLDAPNNAVSLTIGAMILVNLILLFIFLPLSKEFLPALAKRAAMLKAANTPLLYLLAMKAQPLQYFTGCSYVHVNIFHRRLGEFSFFLSSIHSAGHLLPAIVDFGYGLPLDPSNSVKEAFSKGMAYFAQYLLESQPEMITGLAALTVCLTIFATSSSWFRCRSYQLFLSLHGPLQVLFLALAWVHSSFARPFLAIAIGIHIIDRCLLRYAIRLKGLCARTEFLKDDEVVQLSITRHPEQSRIWDRLKPRIASYLAAPWAPGCHVLLTVRSLDAPYKKESHPFYLLSARDNIDEYFRKDEIQLVAKGYGDWSKNLLKNCRLQPDLTGIEVEGPYGSGYQQEMLRDRDICILVASSVGMIPILPIAQSLVDWENGYNPITNETTPRKQEVLLILVHREYRDPEWFQSQLQQLDGTGIDCIAVGPSEVNGNPAGHVANHIEWFIQTRNMRMVKRTGILCSGPRGLQRTVRHTASKIRAEGYKCIVDCLSFDM